MNIIQDALKYYDDNNVKYAAFIKTVKYIKYEKTLNNDIEGTMCTFYNKDKIEILKSRIEMIGKHYVDINMWIWAWSLPTADKSLTNIIRNILIYGTDIYIPAYNTPRFIEVYMLRHQLLTSRFLITNKVQIEIYCALSSYLSKETFICSLPIMIYDIMLDITDKQNMSGIYYFILTHPKIDNN